MFAMSLCKTAIVVLEGNAKNVAAIQLEPHHF